MAARPTIRVAIVDDELSHLSQGGPEFGPLLQKLLDDHVDWWSEARMAKLDPQNPMAGPLANHEKHLLRCFLYDMLKSPP